MTESNLDILITRVVDGCAAPADWDSLEALASTDPAVWRELAQAQRADQLLKGAMVEAVAVADAAELPRHASIDAHAGLRFRARQVATWGGWAAAAVVTLAFFSKPAASQPGNSASLVPIPPSAAEAYKQYIEQGKKEGRVIAEIPDRVLMDASQTEDGKAFEIVFVRQIVERTRVDSLNKVSHGEDGKALLVPEKMVVAGGRL